MALPVVSIEIAFESPPGGDPMAFSNLGVSANPDISSASTLSSFPNTSWSPPTSGLIIVFVRSFRTGGGDPNVPTISGNGLTWVQIATALNATSNHRLTLFAANASGATTGVTTIDFAGQNQDGCRASFFLDDGADLSGGVAAAFVQAVAGSATGTSASITLAAAGNSSNRCISGWAVAGAVSFTPRASWSEMDELGGTGHLETQYRSDVFENTASATWGGSSQDWVGIAAEVKSGGGVFTWADVTPYVREWHVRRGRNHELDKIQTAEASISFGNRDGRFDPNKAAGPYFPNVQPGKRIRIRATYSAVTYDIFNGYIETWPQVWSMGPLGDAEVTITAADAFKILSLAKVSAVRSAEASGTRIAAILDAINWPAGDRSIDAGISTVQAKTYDEESALSALQEVEVTEGGLLFMSADGKVTFKDRTKFVLDSLDTTNYTWGDLGSEKIYADLGPLERADTNLWNRVVIDAPGKTTVDVSDSASRDAYTVVYRTLSLSTLHEDQNEMADRANYLLTRYGTPANRVSSMMIGTSIDYWGRLLDRELHSKLRARKRPVGGGTIEQDSFVEGINHDVDYRHGAKWLVALNLSPLDVVTSYWVLGDSVYGVLDSTTRLYY
jgi:hypothetical protein